MERKTSYNSTFKKFTVRWLHEAFPQKRDKSCFVLSSVLAESLVLRNRQLLVAANSFRQPMTTMLIRTFVILIWLTSVQLFYVTATYGQVSQDDTTILLKAFRNVTIQRQIVYVDTVNKNSSVPEGLEEIFQKGTVTDLRQVNSIILTKKEQNYLLSQLRQQVVWSANLFPNSKRIDTDSIWTFLRQMNAQRALSLKHAVLQKDTVTIKNLRYDYPYVFTFTKPIYIRDNTVCLITFFAMCGRDCGQKETSFYKKENNKWIKWVIVSAGDF